MIEMKTLADFKLGSGKAVRVGQRLIFKRAIHNLLVFSILQNAMLLLTCYNAVRQ